MTGWGNGGGQTSGFGAFEQGEAALGRGKYCEAADYFTQVLKVDPFDARAHRELGTAYWEQGKTEDALASLTRALELDPGDRDTVLACTRVFKAFGKDDFSREVLQSYLDRHPDDAEVRSRIEQLNGEPAQGPNEAAEFFLRHGEAQFQRGNVARAVACFEMAVEEDPQSADAYNNLGVIHLEAGKITEALENFQKALDLKRGDAEILANSARALAMAGQTDTAIDVQREYLRRRPGNNGAWQEYDSLVRLSASPAWSTKGLSKDVAGIYIRTAEMLENAGDFPGAAEAVERALQIDPEAVDALFVLASLHCAIGQTKEAEEVLGHALEIDPSHVRCSEMLEGIRNGAEAGAL